LHPFQLQLPNWFILSLVANSDDLRKLKQGSSASEDKQKAWVPEGWGSVEFIIEGGQGRTYRVRRKSDQGGGAWFVFKRLKNADRADRFHSEIKALHVLDHPGILRIVENGTVEEKPYYIAEYCENGDLSNRNVKGLTTIEKLLLFRQVCSAMAAAHSAKIVHRDIKPTNILVRSDGTLAVGDFGLCLHLDADERLTLTEEAVGARNYMAPELEDGRRDDVTLAADVYSLGKLLYFLFAGRSFSREKHRHPAYDLTHSALSQPENGIQFVYELLDKSIVESPESRFPDAIALVAAVDGAIRKTVLNAHILDMNVKQACLYSVDGEYRPMAGGQANQYGITFVCWRCLNTQHFGQPYNGWNAWWMKR
jgi:serine/threonine protein kinase